MLGTVLNMDLNNHRYSIKNLLFTKAIPNYVIPVPTAGHKVYSCTDCGDKFILEQSYEYHINRKSVKISYFCRPCNQVNTFYNRCNLLSHIRTHTFKTATINVSDLKLEPLPLMFFNKDNLTANIKQKKKNTKVYCPECQCQLDNKNDLQSYKVRAEHYMKPTKVSYCPICLYASPSQCALKAHFRFHLQWPPFYCPQCGVFLSQKEASYPFNHDCNGFNTMRAAMRLKCPAPECHLINPNEYEEHLRKNHLKTVYKCPFCVVACFEAILMENHLKSHDIRGQALIFFQCEMCPGRLVLQSQIENHLGGHRMDHMYPCWSCGKVFKEVEELIKHHVRSHNLPGDVEFAFNFVLGLSKENEKDKITSCISKENAKDKNIYRVVKRCDLCTRSFTYKCKYSQIKLLPNDCPYNCTPESYPTASVESLVHDLKIKCPLCDDKISQDWEEIKKHFNTENHRTHQCLDIQCIIPKINVKKYLKTSKRNKVFKKNLNQAKRKRVSTRNKIKLQEIIEISTNENTSISQDNTCNANTSTEFVCKKCGHDSQSKDLLVSHLLSHRDPCMAYQCMECGECFVVKPSFSKHLLLVHGISDVEDYIIRKHCYNENALLKYQDKCVTNEPLRENQCRICRDQFENSGDLKKHFRVHGMAFLLKNNSIKSLH